MPRISLPKLVLTISIIIGIIIVVHLLNERDLNHGKDLDNIDNDVTEPVQINWVNQDAVDLELLREGLGEHGSRVFLNQSDQQAAEVLMKQNGFNALVSDKISLFRSVRDLRISMCKWLKYDRILPPASIIIPFHNEHWSTLLRTVHSLLLRAPKSLIKELILVDDFSTKLFLKKELDEYVKENLENVIIIRTDKREGLIKARLIGAKSATGNVLVFVDSHCEAGINWLPPLLQPIKHNYRTVTCPFIDVIDSDDFSLSQQDEGARGAFDWNFDYKRLPRLEEDKYHPEKPFESPIMAGGLFAISQKWFWELGGYDEGLEIWGGEQYELSFKIWMCGGRMVDIPCSRIAHVYRKFNPFSVNNLGNYVARNHKRVAEVWLDDWKKYIYQRHSQMYSSIDPGNISKQIDIRLKLQCKPFSWFLKKVAFDLLKYYPVLEPMNVSNGRIFSDNNPTLCMASKEDNGDDTLQLNYCKFDINKEANHNQNFNFTWELDIRLKRDLCLDYSGTDKKMYLLTCHGSGGNQRWVYNPDSHQIIHSLTYKCIDSNPQDFEIFVNECSFRKTQKWTLENINMQAVKNIWQENKESLGY